MLALLFLSVAALVVMGGSYNSLMFGNATEAAFYRLELGKDIRMLSFYCKNILCQFAWQSKAFSVNKATGSNFMQKKRKYNPKAAYSHKNVFLLTHLSYSLLYFLLVIRDLPVITVRVSLISIVEDVAAVLLEM